MGLELHIATGIPQDELSIGHSWMSEAGFRHQTEGDCAEKHPGNPEEIGGFDSFAGKEASESRYGGGPSAGRFGQVAKGFAKSRSDLGVGIEEDPPFRGAVFAGDEGEIVAGVVFPDPADGEIVTSDDFGSKFASDLGGVVGGLIVVDVDAVDFFKKLGEEDG